MKPPHLIAMGAATAAMLIFGATSAEAQQRMVSGRWSPPPSHHGGMHGKHGKHGVFVPVFIVQREPPVIIEREIIREVPVVVEPPPPPPPPRKPYKIGASYSSLPGGCMKLIDEGATYYLCSGEWYRQVGSGSAATYKAVAKP